MSKLFNIDDIRFGGEGENIDNNNTITDSSIPVGIQPQTVIDSSTPVGIQPQSAINNSIPLNDISISATDDSTPVIGSDTQNTTVGNEQECLKIAIIDSSGVFLGTKIMTKGETNYENFLKLSNQANDDGRQLNDAEKTQIYNTYTQGLCNVNEEPYENGALTQEYKQQFFNETVENSVLKTFYNTGIGAIDESQPEVKYPEYDTTINTAVFEKIKENKGEQKIERPKSTQQGGTTLIDFTKNPEIFDEMPQILISDIKTEIAEDIKYINEKGIANFNNTDNITEFNSRIKKPTDVSDENQNIRQEIYEGLKVQNIPNLNEKLDGITGEIEIVPFIKNMDNDADLRTYLLIKLINRIIDKDLLLKIRELKSYNPQPSSSQANKNVSDVNTNGTQPKTPSYIIGLTVKGTFKGVYFIDEMDPLRLTLTGIAQELRTKNTSNGKNGKSIYGKQFINEIDFKNKEVVFTNSYIKDFLESPELLKLYETREQLYPIEKDNTQATITGGKRGYASHNRSKKSKKTRGKK